MKERWYALTDDEKHVWEEWEHWDAKRYEYQCDIYENRQRSRTKKSKNGNQTKDGSALAKIPANETKGGTLLQHIPKKRK